MKKNEQCDHTVAFTNNFINQSELKQSLIWSGVDEKKFLDRRNGFGRLFNYCPKCGEKINWKIIKKMLSDSE